MSSYLEIAERVLTEARKPLTPRQIMAHAYARHLVPRHLYGATQHKTVQARLSEDILAKKEDSSFFRPKPGHFFLRRFLHDTSLPEEYRTPIAARRRTRDLLVSPALVVNRAAISLQMDEKEFVAADIAYRNIDQNEWSYTDPKRLSDDSVLVWASAIVVKGNNILSYRAGRYRDNRDAFAHKQTIVFSTLVSEDTRSLFDFDDLGVRESALRAAIIDLDIPIRDGSADSPDIRCKLEFFARGNGPAFENAVLALVVVHCPSWFEPTKRRLSLNELRWLSLRGLPNNLDDFDPWSQLLWQQISKHTVAAE